MLTLNLGIHFQKQILSKEIIKKYILVLSQPY